MDKWKSTLKCGGRWKLRWEKLSRPAYWLIKGGLMLSCALLTASLLVAVYIAPVSAETMDVFYIYAELYRAPLGVLLLTNLGAAVVEAVVTGN